MSTRQAIINVLDTMQQNDAEELYRYALYLKDRSDIESRSNAPGVQQKSMLGCMKGKVWMSDDFDEPLEDFREYME